MADNNKDYDYAYEYPEIEDPFVSVETCRQTDKPEPQILQSLISKENGSIKDLTAEGFISHLENNQGATEKDSLRFAETLLVPKLQNSKDITSLSKLLSIDESKFQNCVLRSLQKLLIEIDLNEYSVEVIQVCLKSVAQLLQNSQEEDSLQKIVMTVPTVLRSCATAVMLHCSYRKVKKAVFNNMSKSCETIEKVWKTAISRKGMKKEEPLNYQMVQGGLALAATMGKFKYGTHLKGVFQSLDDSLTSSEHDMSLGKIGSSGSVVDQYVVILGILAKMTSNPRQMSERFIKFLHPILHQKYIEKKRTDPEFKQLGHLVICGIAFIARKYSQIETESFHNIIDVFAHEQQLVHEEMSDLLLSVNAKVAQPFISSLNLSEGTMDQLAESYIARAIPGLVVHNQDRRNLPKLSDQSHWMVSGGRLFKNFVRIAIKVPGISGIQIQNCKNSIESNQLVNEFDVLRTIHGGKTANIVKLWAFNPYPSPLPFYVIESFQKFLLDELLHARNHQKFLSEDWMNDRLLDIGSAINFLHQKRIIHRDITINSFAIREYPSHGHEKAVLCSLQMACSNDDEASAKTGHIADIHGENIPTRWSAPESLWEDKYDVYTDIWMIGHVIHSLFTYGCEPYTELYSETTDDIMAKVVSCGLKPYKWPCVPLPYHKLATDCLHFDRGKRIHIDIMRQRLKEIRKKQEHSRKSYYEQELPKISDQQTERQHKPEQGIPLMVKKMKELTEHGDKRKSYFEIKRRVPTSPNPDYAPLVMTLGKGDLLSPDEPKISIKRFELEVEEKVTVDFHDKIFPKMSQDFGEKMCILRWPPVKHTFTTQKVKVILKYSFPAAKNIMDCVSLYFSNAQGEENYHLRIVHQVACLVKRMHEKRWLLVDITGKSIFIQEENDFKACQIRIGRMLRLPSGEDSIKCARKLEDIMYWLPKEVIGHGEISTGSDVYTMAMLFYEFYMAVSGNDQLQCVPFSYKHRSQILSHLNDGHSPDRPPDCPEWLYEDVMKPCWDQDRTSRPSAADIESILARKISEIYERKKDTGDDTYDSFESMPQKLAYQDALSKNLTEDKRASESESDEDYVCVKKHQPTDLCSGAPSSENNGINSYNDEKNNERFILDTNASNETQQKRIYRKLQGRDHFERAHTRDGQSSGKLEDIPNYELFSQSGKFYAGTEEKYTYSETPNYENGTILSSKMNMSVPQPFRSNMTPNMNLPVPHVHKENPIFQTDSSIHPCANDNPFGDVDRESQISTTASTCSQEELSSDSDYENYVENNMYANQ